MWQLQQSQWQKIKLEADPWGVGRGLCRKCHSKFSVYPEISVLWIAAFSFDHRRCCLSLIHRWIIPPKSPKSLILFFSTPHRKGALSPLLSFCGFLPLWGQGRPVAAHRTGFALGEMWLTWVETHSTPMQRHVKRKKKSFVSRGRYNGDLHFGVALLTLSFDKSHATILITVQRTCIETTNGHIFQSERINVNPDDGARLTSEHVSMRGTNCCYRFEKGL